MLKIEVFHSYEEKKLAPDEGHLTDREALIKTLDILDFNASLAKENPEFPNTEDDIDWIDLPLNS
ncbi:MAG: hypothetical protein AAF363_04945 [Bacteroidota bacterium]